jgi:hypothetical protein
MSEKTAASIGERVGDAYSDTGSDQPIIRPAVTTSGTWQGAADSALEAGQRMAQGIYGFSSQRSAGLIAAFGLGFVAAAVLLRRR